MPLEDLIEARLAGQTLPVPTVLQPEYDLALAGHEALLFAREETIGWPTEVDRAPPELPGDYEIVRELGRGGMGVVYLARQKSLARDVAIKVLRPGSDHLAPVVRRFLDEARHLAQMRHPNVVAVHEIGQAESEPYFAMEYIPGESLAGRLTRGPLTPAQAVAILKQIAEAVRHAHEHGIIHRDLKPGNVLLDPEGRALVTDFGLARDVGLASDLTRSGELLGTPAYMAPEQARGDSAQIGERTDVHALGAILYEMLTGRPPYGLEAPAVVFARLLHEEPAPLGPQVPRDLATICLKALAKAPADRYASARPMLEDLKRYEAGEPIQARRPGPLAQTLRWARRQWRLIVTAGVTAMVVAVLALIWLDRSVADLRAWGKEREQRGDLAGAIEVYQRAWQKATGTERADIQADLVRCIGTIDDAEVAVKTARPLLAGDPNLSFGKHDYLLTQALIAELRARHGGRSIAEAGREDWPTLELARTRLMRFLNAGEGTPEQRQSAEQNLAAVEHVLRQTPPKPSEIPTQPRDLDLPQGSIEELRQRLLKGQHHPWEHGRLALALARMKENPNRDQDAILAYESLRSVYPMYSGVARSTVIVSGSPERIGEEALECRLLREAHDLMRQLNRGRPASLTGEIRFTLKGVDLPPDVAVNLDVFLAEKGISPHDQRFRPHRTVPFVGNTARVGVADGTYTLRLQAPQVFYPTLQTRFARLLQIDVDQVPTTVTVAGNRVEVEVPLRQIRELALLGPKAGAVYDPTKDFLTWEEIKGAEYYRVKLSLQQDGPDSRSITGLPEVQVRQPRVCLGVLEDAQAAIRRAKLQPGQIMTWTVEAYDRDDRRIATSLEVERPLLIGRR